MIRLRRLALLLVIALAPKMALGSPPQLSLDVRLDPASRMLRAKAELRTSGTFRFELNRALAVRSATLDGVAVAVELEGGGGRVNVWRVSPRKAGKLRIEYSGTLPALDTSLDFRAAMRTNGAMVSPAGSYLPAASDWYPAAGRPFRYSVTLSLPAHQRGLVPGRLVDEESSGGRYRARFEFDHPADGIELMAGPYVVSEKLMRRAGRAPLRLRTYFYPDLAALAPGYLADSGRYIERYSKLIGPYPFASFSVVASPLPTGFGMPTLTYLGATVLKLPFIRATSLGHEVLHNWWGNGVYVDYSTGNWSEGLTTFMADYAYKEEASPEEARAARLAWLRDYAALPADQQPALAQFRSRAHGRAAAVGYGKSAMVFFMLRDLIGARAFYAGLREFWRVERFRTTSWSDLQAAFEHTSGRDLSWFFSQWVERAGAPRLRIDSANLSPAPGGTRLVLTFSQSAPAYRLRVPVELVTGSDKQTRWIDLAHERQTVLLRVTRAPDGVRLDPQLRLWRVLDPEQLPPILREWVLARTPRVAIVSRGAAFERAAQAMAQAFFENHARVLPAGKISGPGAPVLLIGLDADVDAALARLGLPARPARLSRRGTAHVWTVRRAAGLSPVAVVSVRDAASLQSLSRPLPHYGAQSYLVFEGSRATVRGVWPAPAPMIPVSH